MSEKKPGRNNLLILSLIGAACACKAVLWRSYSTNDKVDTEKIREQVLKEKRSPDDLRDVGIVDRKPLFEPTPPAPDIKEKEKEK